MLEPIPGAAERVRTAARNQISHPTSRHWLLQQSTDDIYAYAPDTLRVWLKRDQPASNDMATLGDHYRGVMTALTPEVEKQWVRNMVRAAKDRA